LANKVRAFFSVTSLSCAALLFVLPGCKAPSKANIELRKQNQELRAKLGDLDRRHAADVAQIRAMETKTGTSPTLSQDRLARLFTVHGLEFGKLTGVNDEGVLKVYVVPTDDSGQKIKAAGSFVVEAFDLESKVELIVRREFSVDEARKCWFGQALLYEYVLPCPWNSPPQHPDVTLKVSFTDALTGRTFTAQKIVSASPASATKSASR